MRKIIANNAILLDQGIYSGASFVSTLFLSRLLTLGDFGLYSTYVLVLFLFASITQAILVQPMQTKVSDLISNPSYGKFLIQWQGFVSFIFLLLSIPIFLFGKPFLGKESVAIAAFCAYLALFLYHDFFRKYFLAKAEKINCLLLDIIYVSFLFIALILIWQYSIFNFLGIFSLLGLSLLPAIFFGLWHTFLKNSKLKVDKSYLKYHLKEGKWFLFAAISQWVSNNIFVMSSGIFLSLEALGALRLVQTVFGIFNIFLQSVENFIIPQVNKIVDESLENAVLFLHKLLKKSLLYILPFLGIMFVFSKSVMEILGGAKYVPFHFAIKGFAVLYLIIFLFYPIRILVRALALNKSFFVAYLISSGVGLISCNFLFKNFDLLGAVIGLIISQLIMISLWINSLKKQVDLWKLYI